MFQEYDFKVIVKPGKLNAGPDHLSKLESGEEGGNLDDSLPDAVILHQDGGRTILGYNSVFEHRSCSC